MVFSVVTPEPVLVEALKTRKKRCQKDVKNLRGTLTNQSFTKLSMEVQDQTKNGL